MASSGPPTQSACNRGNEPLDTKYVIYAAVWLFVFFTSRGAFHALTAFIWATFITVVVILIRERRRRR